MPESLLNILKICLLILLYLFFLRVLRAVWAEVQGPKLKEKTPRKSRRERKPAAAKGAHLLVLEPPELEGRTFDVGEELTIGRAAGCQITLDDTYVSQIHARVFTRDNQVLVEDLGSTNGSYVNREKVTSPVVVHRGDLVQVGKTVMEVS